MTHEDASGWISLILSKKITLVTLLLPYLNWRLIIKHQWLLRKKKKKQQNKHVDTGFVEAQLVTHFNGGGCLASELLLLVKHRHEVERQNVPPSRCRILGLCNSLLTEVMSTLLPSSFLTCFFPFRWFKAMVFPVCDIFLPVFQVYQRVYI